MGQSFRDLFNFFISHAIYSIFPYINSILSKVEMLKYYHVKNTVRKQKGMLFNRFEK